MRTRFAPSPTGDLHIGGAWTALASWALARANGGTTLLRVEDIDPPRIVPGSSERILDDLRWLGLDWDEGPVFQSLRVARYEAAIARLDALGLVYPCDCSRAEIARVASAPHAGEEAVYPGTCREAPRDRELKRAPALRLRVPQGETMSFHDLVCGPVVEDISRRAGDFVLRRGDGVFAYQLAVAVDDAEMGITDVVRADDLLGSTGRQLLLMRLLGHRSPPRYAHVPLVVASDGERLAKRAKSLTVRELAARGVGAEELLGQLAFGLGIAADPAPRTAHAIATALPPPDRWRKRPWPSAWPEA